MTIEPANISSLTMKLDIDAPVADVWRALTDNIGEWWPADFYAGGVEGKRNYSLDATPGGRMLETWAGGGGVLWGTVVTVDPNKRLEVLGAVFPSFGGPNEWFGSWDLNAKGDNATELTFSESGIGRVSDKGTEEKDKGWKFLWKLMKAHVEGSPLPQWED